MKKVNLDALHQAVANTPHPDEYGLAVKTQNVGSEKIVYSILCQHIEMLDNVAMQRYIQEGDQLASKKIKEVMKDVGKQYKKITGKTLPGKFDKAKIEFERLSVPGARSSFWGHPFSLSHIADRYMISYIGLYSIDNPEYVRGT